MNVIVDIQVHGVVYEVDGSCNFYGPLHECEGAIIENIYPATTDASVLGEAADAIERQAYLMYVDRINENDWKRQRRADLGYDYDNSGTTGPDYWIDRESGEYRCG